MHNFGFKIVDRDRISLETILDYVIAHRRPIEVGFYFGEMDAQDLITSRLANTGLAINAHTNHSRVSAFNLHQSEDLLDEHIRQARAFGSRYSILHVARSPSTARTAHRDALFDRILDNLARAEDLCTRLDYRLHIENDFQPIAFYRELFEGIGKRGFRRLHYCFDIGHAKVWSSNSLEEWLGFMGELRAEGYALHCHLHANAGFEDEHLALSEARLKNLCDPDDDYNPYGYPAAFWEIERRFPDAVKVFEVKTELAIENYEAVLAGG